ncbi:MAG TPA: M20/M25/M40 family metallo-hydrolase [Bacteroidales bacterium]|nr:M20/M25/M40 family metallo-hydrolase [Bacteroidales bacterium]
MKNIFICLLFLFSGLYLTAQNPAELNKQFEFSADSKAQPTFNLDSLITACLSDISADSIEHYMRELQGFGTRFLMAPNRRHIAEFLAGKFESFGYTDVELDSFCYVSGTYPYDSLWQYNVIATLPGSGNNATQYLTGGHYDCIIYNLQPYDSTTFVPGADDNGSGTSATLEIARVIALNNIHPDATLKFVCFAAEEYGLLGSEHYTNSARLNNEDIGFYVNMDMIANNIIGDSLVNLYHYENAEYVYNVVMNVCQAYTYLTPVMIEGNSPGSDSYSFWENDYEATFLIESDFSSYYHSAGDTVGNCNMHYCAEIASASCGALLIGAFSPRPVQYFRMVNFNNCMDALLTWLPSGDQNVAGYNIYTGIVPGVYDSVVFVTDTFLILDNLVQGNTYFSAVSVVNTNGFESMLREDSMTSVYCGFDEGVLIVDGSEGGLSNPTDETIDQFYMDVLYGFQTTEYAADSIGSIDLTTLGRYSSILWHINSAASATSLAQSVEDLENYLSCGGNLLLTAYRPEILIGENTYSGLSVHNSGSFFARFLKVKSSQNSIYSYMSGAVPEIVLFDTLHCDSSKTGGMMKFVEVLNPTPDAAGIYAYDSPYDTTHPISELKYENVGVLYDGSDFKTLTLGFPLYYMNKDEVQSMLRYVFENIFGEAYTSIEENATASTLQCYPNPVSDILYVKGAQGNTFTILDASGRIVRSGKTTSNVIDVSSLKSGVYTLRNESSAILFIKE